MSILDTLRIDDRVAIVTGGGGAIGSDLAKGLAEAGAKVVIVGRTEETLAEAARKVKAAGSEALIASGDMTVEADAERVVAETLETFGRVDILVNAIGGGAGKVLHAAHEYPREDWDWIFELNLRSALLPTQ